MHSVTVIGRGGSARPHSRTPHGSLVESAVDSSESRDDIDEVVDCPSTSSAARALAAARVFSGTSCTGDMQAGVVGMNSLILIPRQAPHTKLIFKIELFEATTEE